MKLKEVYIENYRSIKEQTITFETIAEKNCMILVWMNEWWKSNILKAINSINETPDYYKDCNKDAKHNSVSIYIWYEFLAEKEEIPLKEILLDELYNLLKVESICVSIEISKDRTDKQCYINLNNTDKELSGFLYEKESNTIIKWDKDPTENTLQWVETLNVWNLEKFINEKINLEKKIPRFIFWKASPNYLINDPVNLNEFKENSWLSIPLRNIFYISGYTDIKWKIENMCKTHEWRKELADILSENITKYINRIRPEHKIKLEITIEESLSCVVDVIDEDNKYRRFNMDERSDWFKQFISILLNLSIENSENRLKNSVILLDEPEIHLHPSWIKFLRDELLEIAKNNVVVLSTHSIYMIDKTALNRHKKIEKIQWETEIIPIDDNPYKEEVIYESLWTSILEHINPNVIIVEWKTDKDIMDAFTEKFKEELKPLDITVMSADSADKIPTYAKFFNWKYIKWFILVDSDKKWIDRKKDFLKLSNYSKKNVFEINDIHKIRWKEKAELEDLLPLDIIIEQTNEFCNTQIDKNNIDKWNLVFDEIKLILNKQQKWLNKQTEQELKEKIALYVCKDIKKLSKDKIKEKYKEYYSFITSFHKKLKK